MPAYRYKVMDGDGRITQGVMEVATTLDLENRLKNMGFDLINYHEAKTSLPGLRQRRVTRRDLINFCFNLEQQGKAGVPLIEGLRDLRESTENGYLAEVTSALIEQIESGKSLSQSLEMFPRVFDSVFVHLVRAGEKSGKLVEILSHQTENLKWQDEMASQTKKALMYPAFVGVAVTGVVVALMVFLVPELMKFIVTMNQELPGHTLALLAVSDFLRYRAHWLLLAAIVIGVSFAVGYKHNQKFAFFVDRVKLSLPMVGAVQRKMIIARFAHHFALLYGAGITVIECLHISTGIMGNRVLARAVAQAEQFISEGRSLSASFERTGLFPRLVMRMLKVGETTGALDDALINISYFYNRDVRDSLEKMQAMIGPVMTVVLGGLLIWVIMSVIGPIYNALTSVKM